MLLDSFGPVDIHIYTYIFTERERARERERERERERAAAALVNRCIGGDSVTFIDLFVLKQLCAVD